MFMLYVIRLVVIVLAFMHHWRAIG